MKFSEMAPEEARKALAGKAPEEIIEIAKAEGYELSDSEIEQINGGWGGGDDDDKYMNPTCPKCGTKNVQVMKGHGIGYVYLYWCLDCGYEWQVELPES